MEPSAIIGNIANLVITVVQKLNESKELKGNTAELGKLVRCVYNIVQDATCEVDGPRLRRADVVEALQGVERSLQDCQSLVAKYGAKGSIVKFLQSGTFLAEVKSAASSLAQWLGVLQTALGVKHHADLSRQFGDLREQLVGLRLDNLRAQEKQAAQLQFLIESQHSQQQGGQLGESQLQQLRKVVVDALVEAGVGPVATAANSKRASQEEVDEAVSAAVAGIEVEMQQLRLQKQQQEADYLASIAAILTTTPEVERPKRLELQPTRQSPPQSFLCPITRLLLRDPVMLMETGHTFERRAIERHLATSRRNPLTNLMLSSTVVAPNLGLRGAIEEWLQQQGITAEQADDLVGSRTASQASAEQGRRAERAVDVTAVKERARDMAEVLRRERAADGKQVKQMRPDLERRKAVSTEEIDLLAKAEAGDLDAVKSLLADPALNPNVTDDDQANQWGNTALHWAALCGHKEVVQVLLAAGADKEAKNKNGWTALHWAAYNGHKKVVQVLLAAGADKGAKTNDGDTPLQVATKENQNDVVKLLQ